MRRSKVKGDHDVPNNAERRDLFQRCYRFLRLFAAGNQRNQEGLLRNFDLFVSHMGIKGLDRASTLSAIVENNTLLVAQMKESNLRVFVPSIVKYGNRARWLKMLQVMVSVNGQWVHRNQNAVLAASPRLHGEIIYGGLLGLTSRTRMSCPTLTTPCPHWSSVQTRQRWMSWRATARP